MLRFNLTNLITRDLNETKVKKGENELIVANLSNEKVVMREVEGSLEGLGEINIFYDFVDEYFADCLGFAVFENKFYAVFPYMLFTVEDFFYYLEEELEEIGEDSEKCESFYRIKLSILKQIGELLLNLEEKELRAKEISLSDFFLDKSKRIHLFNLSKLEYSPIITDHHSRILTSLMDSHLNYTLSRMSLTEILKEIEEEYNRVTKN